MKRVTNSPLLSSLPHRQLRNLFPRHKGDGASSLPHRQLRKLFDNLTHRDTSSLPHRQLRN
ncbi:TPA: hypothetical protein JFQ21_000208 [Legionella pneumophila]|nr:hypothetical protein [Legionella pneumophila]HAU9859070.1 hypothetical protein [Legionella pneumophila]HAV1007561.1 hypothetical protein [Legionella pneumophila]HAV1083133.1 hypothetical protein [Legionella pneumophila]HAV1086084.1 hypothetical protein [Legionella pneumophila]